MNTYLFSTKMLDSVKMSLTRGQSAWVKRPSETQRSAFSSGRRLSNRADFNNWLTGMTDGDGTFYFAKTQNGSWTFAFQITQSTYNLQCLHFIKNKLGVGRINIDSKSHMGTYRVRDRNHIIDHIIPIFDTHPLLTHKYYKFLFFKEAILIAQEPNLSAAEKNRLISELKLKSQEPLTDCISPSWKVDSHHLIKKTDAQKVMDRYWLVGFTEAEGSFYITHKDKNRLAHGFEITQKFDLIVMTAIALILDLKVTHKKTYITVVTTNQKSIQAICDYFLNTMKGCKSLEYKIWARSFSKKKRGYDYLLGIQNYMRSIRSIRYDKNFKKIG
jgi:hypothetical protein